MEQFADRTHECWSDWMVYLFSKCTKNNDGTATIPKWAVDRWLRQIETKYCDLSEEEREEDRKVVRKYYEDLVDLV